MQELAHLRDHFQRPFNAATLFYGTRKVNKMENNLCSAYRLLGWKILLNTPDQAFVEDRHLRSGLGS